MTCPASQVGMLCMSPDLTGRTSKRCIQVTGGPPADVTDTPATSAGVHARRRRHDGGLSTLQVCHYMVDQASGGPGVICLERTAPHAHPRVRACERALARLARARLSARIPADEPHHSSWGPAVGTQCPVVGQWLAWDAQLPRCGAGAGAAAAGERCARTHARAYALRPQRRHP